MSDLRIFARGGRLRVTGLRETLKALEQAGVEATDMRDLMHDIGMIVVTDAQRRVPRGASSKLVKSLRAGRGKTKAVVYAGRKSVPYAGVVNYGTPAGYVRQTRLGKQRFDRHATHFLDASLEAKEKEIFNRLIDGIGKILDKNNLPNDL